MKRGGLVGYVFTVLFNALALIPLTGSGQQLLSPLHRPILLSGNFGELRATHFHTGIDIRTGGMEGLPVICVQDGQLVRAFVSPTGYGQALYVAHPDGTTTVYGHLQRFVSPVAEVVRAKQYEQESFQVDLNLASYGIYFKQGDTIAYSGNTGSSGGPHLHFEVRNTKTEHPYNPLLFYKILDQKPPVARILYLYMVQGEGGVELLRRCPLKNTGVGRYDAGMVSVPEGKVGIGLWATDYMNDSWNRLGVYRLDVMAGQDTLFRMQMDSCAFEQSRYINEIKDFDRHKEKETVYRCFGYHADCLMWTDVWKDGFVYVQRDSVVRVKVNLWDINGNHSVLTVRLKGKVARQDTCCGTLLRYDEMNVVELPDGRLELDSGALFYSLRNEVRIEQDTLGRKIWILADKDVPLLKKGRLLVRGNYSDRCLVYELTLDGRLSAVETSRQEDGLLAEIGYLNRYVVMEDTIAPTIRFLGKLSGRILRFEIDDELSGIGDYRGEVNGKWCLFSYDPRVKMLECGLSEPVFVKGRNRVEVTVRDKAGNIGIMQVEIVN